MPRPQPPRLGVRFPVGPAGSGAKPTLPLTFEVSAIRASEVSEKLSIMAVLPSENCAAAGGQSVASASPGADGNTLLQVSSACAAAGVFIALVLPSLVICAP